MAGQTTLIVTTRSGVRPLGVRGEPLHNAAPQLRRVVRRRLGDDAAGLLADPQPHEDGKAIDWYADWPGQVQPLSALAPERRAEVLAGVERTLAEIRRLGDALAGAGPREDMGVVGLSLQLAARAPAQSFIFLVGERPVIVCWGYEKEAAASLLPATLPRPPEPARSVLLGAGPCSKRPPSPPCRSLRPVSTTIPWLRTLLLALPLLLLLLGAAWLLREMLPADPSLSLATREGPPAPPAGGAAARSDARPEGRLLDRAVARAHPQGRAVAGRSRAQEAHRRLQAAGAAEAAAAGRRRAAATQARTGARSRADAGAAARRAPTTIACACLAPTNDYSFMSGCWRTDPFRHEPMQGQPGVSSYCFDANGNGQLEWRRGRTACRTRAFARFDGPTLRIRDGDSSCNDGSRWYADQLVCQRGADNVAQCSGRLAGRVRSGDLDGQPAQAESELMSVLRRHRHAMARIATSRSACSRPSARWPWPGGPASAESVSVGC